MRCGRAILVALLLLGLDTGAGAHEVGERYLVLISLDGLRPEFYLDDAFAAPELRALVRAGSAARAAEGVFPTVTYPSHASIVTGVRPARHGILFNVLIRSPGARGRWYEEASDLRASPLWEWARAAGLRTAGVSWPSTLGARIDLLLPERDYHVRPDPLDVMGAAVTPGLLERLGSSLARTSSVTSIEWDAFLTAVSAAIIRDARPHLLLLHLVQLDYFQHRGGRAGAEVKPALARVDAHSERCGARWRRRESRTRTSIIITGDHGFQDVERTLFPNQILAGAGLRDCPRAGDWVARDRAHRGWCGGRVRRSGRGSRRRPARPKPRFAAPPPAA